MTDQTPGWQVQWQLSSSHVSGLIASACLGHGLLAHFGLFLSLQCVYTLRSHSVWVPALLRVRLMMNCLRKAASSAAKTGKACFARKAALPDRILGSQTAIVCTALHAEDTRASQQQANMVMPEEACGHKLAEDDQCLLIPGPRLQLSWHLRRQLKSWSCLLFLRQAISFHIVLRHTTIKTAAGSRCSTFALSSTRGWQSSCLALGDATAPGNRGHLMSVCTTRRTMPSHLRTPWQRARSRSAQGTLPRQTLLLLMMLVLTACNSRATSIAGEVAGVTRLGRVPLQGPGSVRLGSKRIV